MIIDCTGVYAKLVLAVKNPVEPELAVDKLNEPVAGVL